MRADPALTRPLRVLVVDDSPMMRGVIRRALDGVHGMQVVGAARHGGEVLEQVRNLRPDVVTLDVEMPVRNGLEVLEELMRTAPTPVLMLSGHTSAGAEITLRALDLGAADFLLKPADPREELFRDELVAKLLGIACRHSAVLDVAPPPPREVRRLPSDGFRLLLLGASTGGPRALQRLLSEISPQLPAGVIIAQHLPELFTIALARRLADCCALPVRVAGQGERIRAGEVLFAPGGYDLEVVEVGANHARTFLVEPSGMSSLQPSVNVLLASAARCNGPRSLGMVLTGMGSDGASGLLALRKAGGVTLAEDESTCVVYGMPRACVEAGAVEAVVRLDEAAKRIHDTLGVPDSAREGRVA